MNLAHFKLVRRQIADLQPGQFWMELWASECGTTACLAGWITKLNYLGRSDELIDYDFYRFAREFLDVSVDAADWLFFAGWRMHKLPTDLWWLGEGDLSLSTVSRDRVLQELDAWIAGDVPKHLRDEPSDADNHQEPLP